MLVSHFLTAQNLTGKVNAEIGETLIGVSIKNESTNKGAISDIDLIEEKINILVFSYVGYEQQIINYDPKMGNKTPLTVNSYLKTFYKCAIVLKQTIIK